MEEIIGAIVCKYIATSKKTFDKKYPDETTEGYITARVSFNQEQFKNISWIKKHIVVCEKTQHLDKILSFISDVNVTLDEHCEPKLEIVLSI